MNWNRILTALVATVAALGVLAGVVYAESRAAKLEKTLLGPGNEHAHRLTIPENDSRLKAIQGLQEIGSRDAVDALLAFLTTRGANRKLKQHALVALGMIGSEYSVKAIGTFEQWAEARRKNQPGFTLGLQEHPSCHFGPYPLNTFADCSDSAGKEWALLSWGRYGHHDLWIVEIKQDKAVSFPILLDTPIWSNPQAFREMMQSSAIHLSAGPKPGAFVLDLAGESFPFTLAEIKKDTDADGLTDIEEDRMSTDPKNPDTDGDGVQDGADPCPLAPKTTDLDENAQIRQAVFSLYFATSVGRGALLMVGGSPFAKQEYIGYMGPVLWREKPIPGFVNITSLSVTKRRDSEAEVRFGDYIGSLASSGNEVKLKKIHGRWVVVAFRMTYIS